MGLRFRPLVCLLVAVPLAAAVVGCDSGGSSGGGATQAPVAPAVPPAPPPVPPPAAAAAPAGVRSIAQLLPADGAIVDVMDGVLPDGLMEATLKFNEARRRDPQWWADEVRKAGPGNAVPYDPKMGITQHEYDLIVRGPELITLQKVRSLPVSVQTVGDRVTISGLEGMPELNGIEFDLAANTVKTQWGEAQFEGEVQASPKQKLTEPWNGYAWSRITDIQAPNAVILSVHLGQMTQSGRGMLFFDAKYLDAGGLQQPIYILYYDLPR